MSCRGVFSYSGLVVAIVCSFASVAFSEGAPASPEFRFFETLTALQGENLPRSELQSEVNRALTEYQSAAPLSGQEKRTKQALIDLNILTPAQADALVETINAESAGTSLTGLSRAKDLEALVTRVASSPMSGAQFSGCSRDYAIGGAAVVVGITLMVLQTTSLGQAQDEGASTSYNNSYIYGGFSILVLGAIIAGEMINVDC